MLTYKDIKLSDINALAQLYLDTFNAPPWNDKWSIETAAKRIHQMINVEDFFGLAAYHDNTLCGMVLGSKEQFFDGVMFNLKEFCVENKLQGQGFGTQLLKECETRLRIQGVDRIMLFTSRNDATEGFYHKRGFSSHDGMIMMGKHL